MDMHFYTRPPEPIVVMDGCVVVSTGQAVRPAYPGAGLSTYVVARIARDLVARTIDVSPLALAGKARGARRLAVARQLAMNLVHLVAGRSQQEVARAFYRNRATASHHMEIVEDLRDCVQWDRFVELLGQRYSVLLLLASLPSIRIAWREALKALDHAAFEGGLEGDAVRSAEYLVATFKAEAAREPQAEAA